MDRLDQQLVFCPLLQRPAAYVADTVDLTQDADARYVVDALVVGFRGTPFGGDLILVSRPFLEPAGAGSTGWSVSRSRWTSSWRRPSAANRAPPTRRPAPKSSKKSTSDGCSTSNSIPCQYCVPFLPEHHAVPALTVAVLVALQRLRDADGAQFARHARALPQRGRLSRSVLAGTGTSFAVARRRGSENELDVANAICRRFSSPLGLSSSRLASPRCFFLDSHRGCIERQFFIVVFFFQMDIEAMVNKQGGGEGGATKRTLKRTQHVVCNVFFVDTSTIGETQR